VKSQLPAVKVAGGDHGASSNSVFEEPLQTLLHRASSVFSKSVLKEPLQRASSSLFKEPLQYSPMEDHRFVVCA
jgi:hypothetical protein